MKIDFNLLEKMVTAGASARMIVDYLKEKSGEATEQKYAAAFLQFRAAYPKRDGSNPWRPAEQSFYRLCKAGVEPGAIVSAAIRFAEQERQRGKVGTPYIPQAVTWLNQHRFADVRELDCGPDIRLSWDLILQSYKKFGHWSRYAGPDPTSPACRCPRELLVKHGIIQHAPA